MAGPPPGKKMARAFATGRLEDYDLTVAEFIAFCALCYSLSLEVDQSAQFPACATATKLRKAVLASRSANSKRWVTASGDRAI